MREMPSRAELIALLDLDDRAPPAVAGREPGGGAPWWNRRRRTGRTPTPSTRLEPTIRPGPLTHAAST
jgi:hypothetical protein